MKLPASGFNWNFDVNHVAIDLNIASMSHGHKGDQHEDMPDEVFQF